MSDELRAVVKERFVAHGAEEPTDEQCDAIIEAVRKHRAARFPLTVDDLARFCAPDIISKLGLDLRGGE